MHVNYSLLLGSLLAMLIFSSCKEKCSENNPPGTQQGFGCGNFILYDEFGNNDSVYIWVTADRNKLALTRNWRQYDLTDTSLFRSGIYRYNTNMTPFCTDIVNVSNVLLHQWAPVSGKLYLSVPADRSSCDEIYFMNATIEDAVFRDSAGNEIIVDRKDWKNVRAGFTIP